MVFFSVLQTLYNMQALFLKIKTQGVRNQDKIFIISFFVIAATSI